MAVFDVNAPPSQPDSDLDPDLSLAQIYQVAGDVNVEIAPGDWVDVDPQYVAPDSVWGSSFQVCQVYPNAIGILVTDVSNPGSYMETQLTPVEITNNYRRMGNV